MGASEKVYRNFVPPERKVNKKGPATRDTCIFRKPKKKRKTKGEKKRARGKKRREKRKQNKKSRSFQHLRERKLGKKKKVGAGSKKPSTPNGAKNAEEEEVREIKGGSNKRGSGKLQVSQSDTGRVGGSNALDHTGFTRCAISRPVTELGGKKTSLGWVSRGGGEKARL